MGRRVKGILFADYVRMIRSQKTIDWPAELLDEDVVYLDQRIDADAWYPMETFERFGEAILRHNAGGSIEAVRLWGQLSVDPLIGANPTLLSAGNPVETLNRFRVLRATYFDFDALEVLALIEGHARIAIAYHMGDVAEEAASYQAMGFFERLLETAGASEVSAKFVERSWAGDPRTVLELSWNAE